MSNFYLITPERLVHTYAQMYCMQRRMQTHLSHTNLEHEAKTVFPKGRGK